MTTAVATPTTAEPVAPTAVAVTCNGSNVHERATTTTTAMTAMATPMDYMHIWPPVYPKVYEPRWLLLWYIVVVAAVGRMEEWKFSWGSKEPCYMEFSNGICSKPMTRPQVKFA